MKRNEIEEKFVHKEESDDTCPNFNRRGSISLQRNKEPGKLLITMLFV